MDLTYEGVVPTVVAAGPELRDELAAHIRHNDEVLPHVFVGRRTVGARDAVVHRSLGAARPRPVDESPRRDRPTADPAG